MSTEVHSQVTKDILSLIDTVLQLITNTMSPLSAAESGEIHEPLKTLLNPF